MQYCTPSGPCPSSKGVRESQRRATVVDKRKRGHCERVPLLPGFLSTGRNKRSLNDKAHLRRLRLVGQPLRQEQSLAIPLNLR